MNKKSTIVIFIGCLLILANFSILTSAATISAKTKISVEKVDPTSIKSDNVITPETYKVVPTTEEKSTPTLEDDKITVTQQDEENIVSVNVDEGTGYVVEQGQQTTPGAQYIGISNAGGPYQGQVDIPVAFQSKGIIQLGAAYKWDFGDNSAPVYGRNPTHTYKENGVYWATLKVTKTNGETYLDIAPVYIGQQGDALVPKGGYSYQGDVGEEITFDASQSTGANKYRWDFGDGEGYTPWSSNPVATHTYEKERVYQVKLEIRDNNGKTRYDVLHADIGCSFSSFRNLFFNNGGILDDIISLLYDNQALGSLFCQWLQVKLYYKYNDNPGQTVQIYNLNSQGYPIVVDVNSDGVNDVSVGGISILSPREAYGPSPFNPSAKSMQFDSYISGITLLSGSCVGIDDDLTLCLQFTFPPFLTNIYQSLGINLDPTVRLGIEFEAGKEKPTANEPVGVVHYFRPYLIECLQSILAGQSSQQSQENQYQNQENSNELILNPQTNTYQYTTTYIPGYSSAVKEIAQEAALDIDSGNLQINAQQATMMPQDVTSIYPEHGIAIDGANGECISLLASVSTNTGYTITFKAAFDSLFTPFMVTHRRGGTLRDVDVSGDDASAVTFSITAENSYGSATLGMAISPAQRLGLHLNIDRTNVERQATLHIDNPPAIAMLFIETENAQGQKDGHYLYVANIPSSISLSWVPSLANGHVQVTRDSGSNNLEIGLCDDIRDPNTQVYFSNIPITMGLSWQVSLEDTRSVTLSSEIAGLTLNAKLRDVTQPNQIVNFVAAIQNDLDITIKWNPQEGYFALDRSETTIDFSFVVSQDNLILDVNGVYATGSGEGLKFTFNNFQAGVIELDSGKEIGLNIKAFSSASETTLKTELLLEQNGKTTVNWSNDLNYIKLDSDHTIKFGNFELINPKFGVTASEIKLQNNGNVKLTWDHSKHITIETSTNLAATFNNFDVTAESFGISADEVKLAGSSTFGLSNEEENLHLSGANQVTLTNFEGNIRFWSGKISYAKSVGNFDIFLKPFTKYYYLNMDNKLTLNSFDIKYDSPSDQYDTEFGVDAFNMEGGSSIWFNFSSPTPKFQIAGYNIFSFNDLYLKIGPKLVPTIDFSIPTFEINGVGQIYSEINNQHLLVSADVAFSWGIALQSMNYGSWQVDGSYSGSGTMTLTEWQIGQSGTITFSIPQNKAIHHSLNITHNQLSIQLGNVNLNSGTVTFNWKREQPNSNGYFNVTDSGITGTLALCKINYNNPTNPFEFELGSIQVKPGNLYMDWQRQGDQKMFHVNNGLTVDLSLIKLKWDDKTLTLGEIVLKPGQFRFTSDPLNKTVTLKNSMNGFGPLCTYEDSNRKLSVDLLNLVSDYSKTMTLKWYEDSNNQITGVYLDTDGSQLVDWITFTSIRYGTETTGRRIALGGFQADDFQIKKNANDKLEVSGHLYIANHLTYSKLVNPSTDEWQDLDIQWDLTSTLKSIKFESEFDLSIKLLSLDIFGVQFNSEFDLTDYMEVKWDLSGDSTKYKEFHFDTNGEVLSSAHFKIVGPNNRGIEIIGGGISAENFYVKWKLWPPLQADLIIGGTIEYESATVYGNFDGSTWIQIWPIAQGSQHY